MTLKFEEQFPTITLTGDKSKDSEMFETLLAVQEGPRSMRRDRPYNGQSHTDHGLRGQTEVKGLTMRDIRDCFIRAFIISHPFYKEGTLITIQPNEEYIREAEKGVDAQLNGNCVYDMVGDIDPIAVAQNLTCEIEKLMGIFPNVPALNFCDNKNDD